MSLASADLPSDPDALRAFALACQNELAAATAELQAAKLAVQLRTLEIEKLKLQIAKRWRRRLGDRVAAPAGVFRADMADHPEPAGDIVEDFGDVFAKAGHVAAASRTGAGPVVHRFVHDRMARQVVRQGLALWPVCFPA